MSGMIFRSFRKRNRSQKDTDTVYSEYSYSGILPKERAQKFQSKIFPREVLKSYFPRRSVGTGNQDAMTLLTSIDKVWNATSLTFGFSDFSHRYFRVIHRLIYLINSKPNTICILLLEAPGERDRTKGHGYHNFSSKSYQLPIGT